MKVSAMHRGIWVAVVALSGLLSGCAVLTVDVDVYKGSLVNEEHVQLHQLVALATAAKPMLVQLRDSIEWPGEEMPSEWTVTKGPPPTTWYKQGYIPPPPIPVPPEKGFWCKRANYFCSDDTKKYNFFQKSLAVRVNQVLGLYEELDSDGMIIETKVDDKDARGLHWLTKIYGKSSGASDHEGIKDDEKRQAEHRLIDALVEFSAKVLFLANHEGLASPPGTPGLLLGGAEKLNRGLFGDFLTDHSMYALFNSELAETKKQQYVRVLQAVGNSILFSANELRERKRHASAGVNKVKAEVAAVNLSYSLQPGTVLANLLTELQAEKDNADNKLVKATARKAIIAAQIGSSTSPLTGLRADEKTAKDLLDAARQTLATYQGNNKKLKAIHGVLTNEMVANIRSQWAREGKEKADSLSTFLKGSDGLASKIANTLAVKKNTSTSEEIQRVTDADGYVKDPETEGSFQVSFPRNFVFQG
jgi:hypothetical protein